jgi:type IV pilus assembly protein PilV
MQLKQRGFSLMEVMVALVVTTVGLLGLAKMESLALSSTGVASSRSVAAILASSMASAMHANPGFWQAGLAPATTTVTSTSVSSSGTGYATGVTCSTAGTGSCPPASMAAYDVYNWQTALNASLPVNAFVATINCLTGTTTGTPVTCNIQLQWAENAVASNAGENNTAGITAAAPSTYTLFVQP